MPVIGTAGHVDHGKSTLVQALTGIDPDRLREEKERGLTIDLGFAWLELPSGLEVGIVDVPGHERFIKNMLAGAGGIDLALLVVAADEGPRPQTREHVAILDLLEVPGGVVVITKCDLVEPDYLDLVQAELEETLDGSLLAGAPALRVSATTGAGLEDLKAAIDTALARLPSKRDIGQPRVPIDRAFTIKGFGAVVTGTLIDGWLEVGQELEVLPGGLRCRVRGLQRHRTKVDSIGPGTRTAVNLAGIREEDLHRGMTIARPGGVAVANSLVVRLQASGILSHALDHDAEVTLLCATAEAQAKVRLLDADSLKPGQQAWSQLLLEPGVPAVVGDHVVLRTPNETVAGGRIVTINGRRLRRNHAATLDALEQRLAGSPESRVVEALSAGPLSRSALAAIVGLEAGVLDETLAELRGRLEIAERRGLLYRNEWAVAKGAAVLLAATTYLASQPLRASLPREHLRGAVRLDSQAFDLLIEVMAEDGSIELRSAGVAPFGYEPHLSGPQAAEAEAFLRSLRALPYSPAPEKLPAAPLLAFLAERGEIVDTGTGVVFAAEAFAEMLERTRAHIETSGSVSLAEVRDMFGNSRKYAQAFLEHLDALHITRRTGDVRTLR